MKQVLQFTSAAVFVLFAAVSEAGTMRAQDVDQATWGKAFAGELRDFIIEFRQGDTLPVSITAEGDFFETSQAQSTPLKIKKDLWIKIDGKKFEVSLDGANYKPVSELVTGAYTIGVSSGDTSGGRATGLNMNMSLRQK